MPTTTLDPFFDAQRQSLNRGFDQRSANLDAILKVFNDLQGGTASGGDFASALLFGAGSNIGDDADISRIQTKGALSAALQEAFRLRDIEDQRFEDSSAFLRGEFDAANADFADSEKRLENLFFSQAADAAGGQAREGVANLRSSLGARGINPNSGLAAGLASRVATQQQNQIVGATRDIALDSSRRRAVQRSQRLNSAFGLANFENQSPSLLGADALGSISNVLAGREANDVAAKEARKARNAQERGAVISGIGGLLGRTL